MQSAHDRTRISTIRWSRFRALTTNRPGLRHLAVLTLLVVLIGIGAALWQGPTRAQVSGAPVLVITTASRPFGQYYAEILRGEGLNAFSVADLTQVSAATLAAYDLVILAETTLTNAQVTMFTTESARMKLPWIAPQSHGFATPSAWSYTECGARAPTTPWCSTT